MCQSRQDNRFPKIYKPQQKLTIFSSTFAVSLWQFTMWKILVLLVTFQVSFIYSQSIISCSYGRQPSNQAYTCTLTINNPTGSEFDTIPGQHLTGLGNQDVINLIANFQNTRNIPAVICRQFPNLVSINMELNQISDLNENSFVGCGALLDLTLANNNIGSVPSNSFLSNTRLRDINLS